MRLHRILGALALAVVPVVANASVTVTISAPTVETSAVPGVTTETFDGITAGFYTTLPTAVGTLTAPTAPGLDVRIADEYGGAGGTGNYMGIAKWSSPNTTATLALDSAPLTYFGFWLSALDANNVVEVYSGGVGGTQVAYINQSSLLALINATVTPSAYYGNPSGAFAGQDNNEPFVYVNVTGTGGSTFDTVVFTNNGTGTGNELDNFSIVAASQVPLPSAAGAGLVGLVLVAGVVAVQRRHTRQGC